jgi:hypothetical protein
LAIADRRLPSICTFCTVEGARDARSRPRALLDQKKNRSLGKRFERLLALTSLALTPIDSSKQLFVRTLIYRLDSGIDHTSSKRLMGPTP